MESLLFAALFAAPIAADGASHASLDVRCYQLMAQLSESEDPRIRSTGLVAAQYFLGRIDAGSPGTDLESLPAMDSSEQDELLPRCAAAMSAGGRDFRAIGETLAAEGRGAA